MTNTITIPVGSKEYAQYSAMSEDDRRRIEFLLWLDLQNHLKRPHRTLQQSMNDCATEAGKNGLTEEILQELLDEHA